MDSSTGTGAPRVLVVDDDPAVARVLGGLLTQDGIQALTAASAEEALGVLGVQPIDVVVTDLKMPGMGGMGLLTRVQEQWPEVPVVLITAHGTVATAVEAMKVGAADFVQKPFDREEILFVVRKALAAAARHDQRPSTLPSAARGTPLLGSSPAMRACDERISRAAKSVASVLFRGESGTGKELAARALHARSDRQGGPFVVVHAGALPESLLESELFGHERGAFTGAVARKPGRVELASGGTLFLDELGDIPLSVQVKLLRVVQERQLERLGGTQTLTVDVRFVAATHRDLEAMVAAGTFREDLFFRLNVIGIQLPPLRERAGDIAELARHFCRALGTANGRPDAALADDALAVLAEQRWPGNVRQLQNFIERLVVMSEQPTIDAAVTRRELAFQFPGTPPAAGVAPGLGEGGATLEGRRRDAERAALLEALQKAGNNRTLAARILGVGRRTLYNKLEELGIE